MNPEWTYAVLGGVLIGLAASILLIAIGRICGISGIVWGIIKPTAGDTAWRWSFLIGLIVGALFFSFKFSKAFSVESPVSIVWLAVAGLLVGFGTRLGGGCTSGHGVCGISRLSSRSIAATGIFISSGALTVYVLRHILGVMS